VPPQLPAAERTALGAAATALSAHLAGDFGLRGLFGVDLVWDGERAWVLEVNPRPTGSLETIAAVHGSRPFGAHLDGCAGRLPGLPPPSADLPAAAGKAVVFATQTVRVPDTRGWPARGIRDVPHPGERIAAGHPICTLLATGPSPEAVLAELDGRAAALRTALRDRVEAHAAA
jgi:predicted ATP-grasp superfamily ATP-dependent carboligase